MAKRVLDVGQCGFDHGSIDRLISGAFNAETVPAHDLNDALEQLRGGQFDLVLVNRKLDRDYSDGLDLLRAVKADAALAAMPIMLVSNHPEAQQAAVAVGAEPGFGKAELGAPETLEKLRRFLS
jgi:DNA-binding response OmpR family regulator